MSAHDICAGLPGRKWLCLSALVLCLASVTVRGDDEPVTVPGTNPQKPEVKMLAGLSCWVRVWERDGPRNLRVLVYFATGRNGVQIRYGDVGVRAVDKNGGDIPVSTRQKDVSPFMDVGGTKFGVFELAMQPDQQAAFVEVTKNGQKQTFTVTEVLKPVPGPP